MTTDKPSARDAEPRGPVRLGDILDIAKLHQAIEDRYINVTVHGNGRLRILNYTAKAQYERAWTNETLACRGLIIDCDVPSGGLPTSDAVVVARPFPKFANSTEHGSDSVFGPLPVHRPFDVFEKMDGSLAIMYSFEGNPALATRGSFTSDQAIAATKLWQRRHRDVIVPDGVTLLFEYISPWNRIVVDYGEREELVLLAVIDIATGADVSFDGFSGRTVRRVDGWDDFDTVQAHVERSTEPNAEGFVVRFQGVRENEPSVRAKLKLSEYVRLHRIVTGVSTTVIWEHLASGAPIDELVERVPDEFHQFVTSTVRTLTDEHRDLVESARHLAGGVADMERKEAASVVLAQRLVPSGLAFAALDGKDVSAMAWRHVKPEHAHGFTSS